MGPPLLRLAESAFHRAQLERFGWHRPRSCRHLFGDAPVIVAHRGGAGLAPENTMAAFLQAQSRGLPIELDVTRCRSGEIVVIHDDTVDRTTGRPGRVDALTWTELAEFDAGAWFDPRYAGERIPTLRQVLREIGRDGLLDIEIKPGGPRAELASAVVDLIAEARLLDRALVSSFDPRILAHVRRRAPELRRAQIYGRFDDGELRLHERLAMRTLALNALAAPDLLVVDQSLVDLRYLANMRARGYVVWGWTPNSAAELERLFAIGVDGVITDRPDLALELRRPAR